jgi:glycosyltransferase involved in cell wall biosynthesis
MKIAVYTIAKNEENFVERWYESAKEADYLVIADTGSTDKTVELAESLGIIVSNIVVNPWRFDVARNKSLEAVPEDADICIALDMDEVLQPGWRQQLESIQENTTRPRYSYTWSWNEDGTPGLIYGGDKIHSRNNYSWRHPVHEVLSSTMQEVQEWIKLEIHHHPDNTKSRGQYFPLLELAVQEDPEDDRNTYYLAREYFFQGMMDKSAKEFKRHLSLPRAIWRPERASSMRYLSKIEIDEKESWLLRSAAECPNRREAWVDLAQYYYEKSMWPQCYSAANYALSIKEKPLEYLCESFAWGEIPHDLLAIAAYRMGLKKDAVHHGKIATDMNPTDPRLSKNLEYYLEMSM